MCAYIVATAQVRDHRDQWFDVLSEGHDCSYGRHDVRDVYTGIRHDLSCHGRGRR